jgi:hypothetical protein
MRRVAAKLCPSCFCWSSNNSVEVAQDMLECTNRDPEFVKTVITVDEPETKVQSSQWK